MIGFLFGLLVLLERLELFLQFAGAMKERGCLVAQFGGMLVQFFDTHLRAS
jgi:hypothetical protein